MNACYMFVTCMHLSQEQKKRTQWSGVREELEQLGNMVITSPNGKLSIFLSIRLVERGTELWLRGVRQILD